MQKPSIDKIISVSNLCKSYGSLQVLKNVSFEVDKGSIFGIIGPNGAGKTTTLEILETLIEKDSGSVYIDGFNLDVDKQSIKQIIGVQLQSAGYFPNLNLKDLILLFAGLYNINVDPIKILATVNLEDKWKNKFKELSGGQQQRFSIATTMIHQPKIVFLDEPTTRLDPQARRDLWQQIQTLRANGVTVILTTHYLDEAEFLCDTIAIIDEGVIKRVASPTMLINELIDSGYKPEQPPRLASLEDVFIQMTGKNLRY